MSFRVMTEEEHNKLMEIYVQKHDLNVFIPVRLDAGKHAKLRDW